MNISIEQPYQNIATYMVQEINDQWTSAWITAEVNDENVFSLNAYYHYQNEDNGAVSLRIHPLIPQWFMDLRNHIKKDNNNTWSYATFNLKPDGPSL